MKIKTFAVLLLTSFALIWFCGCEKAKRRDVDEKVLKAVKPPAERSAMPRPSGGLVLSVESSAISANEIIEPVREHLDKFAQEANYEKFRANARPLLANVLVQKIADIKLYEKAKAALPENIDQAIIDRIVEEEVQKFIAQCGGNYATVEQMLKKMGTTWKDFYQHQRRAIFVQSFISQEIKVEKPVTYSELVEYYNTIKNENYAKKGQIEFRLIDLEIEKFVDPNDPNAIAQQKAEKLAAQLSERIKKGEDFAELAKKYSNDHTAQNGGLWKPISPGSLAQPYNAIEKTIEDMNVGQVCEPVAAGGHIFIIKLENKQQAFCEPFEKVQTEVEMRYTYERRKKMVDDMMSKIIEQVDLAYADDFLEYCVEKAWQDCHTGTRIKN